MRSLLFVPGDSERKLEKSLSSGADARIVDLEDSVSVAAKPAATSRAKPGSWNWRADTLTLIRTGAAPACCQATAWCCIRMA